MRFMYYSNVGGFRTELHGYYKEILIRNVGSYQINMD